MADKNMVIARWVSVGLVILLALTGGMVSADLRSNDRDDKQADKCLGRHDDHGIKINEIQTKYAAIETHLSYLRDARAEQKVVNAQVLGMLQELQKAG